MVRHVVALLMALLWWGSPAPVFAHADLQQAEPAQGASAPAPPSALRLRFTEPLDRSATRIEVLDERGAKLSIPDLAIGPPNDRQVTVELGDIGEGVYTVRWWSLSQVDGHRWQGVYRFGVGRVPPPADGAQAPLPSPVEVAIKWLALIATSMALGTLAFRVLVLDPSLTGSGDGAGDGAGDGTDSGEGFASSVAPKTIARLARSTTFSLVALGIVSVAETAASYGLFSTVQAPDVAGFGGLGKAGALALLRLFLVPMIAYLAAPGGSSGMALAFAALLVLTRAQGGHAANGGLGPVLVDATHQLAGSAWIGGAATFGLLVPVLLRERPSVVGPIGVRFGRLALAAAGLAVLTGFASGWLLGLEPERLISSNYGLALAVKVGLVAVMLAVAFVVWRRRAARPTRRPGLPLALEVALGAGVLLTAGSLALLPPPGETSALPFNLVQPAGREKQLRLHLILDRVRAGAIQAEVQVADATGRAQGQTGVLLTAVEIAPLDGPLNQLSPPAEAYAEEQPDGRQLATFSPFWRPGWWRVTVSTTVHLQGVVETTFDLLVPDPNRSGLDPPEPEPLAEQQFAASLARMEQLRSVRQSDLLADGAGGVVLSTATYAAPDRFSLLTAEGEASVAVGPTQAFRRADEPWRTVRRTASFRFPTYAENYLGATSQRLGHNTTIDGAPARVVTFYVPRDRAWYCWWVDAGDGKILREAMVAASHYMTTQYTDFDAPVTIDLPQ